MSEKRKVLENSFFYTLSTLLVKGISFFLLPLYTLFITPEEYGTVNLILNFSNVAIYIVGFSLYSSVLRFYTDYKANTEMLKRFYGTIISFILISGMLFLFLGVVFHNLIVNYFFRGISFYPIIIIALITITFTCFHTIHQNILQSMQKGLTLTKINLLVFALQVGLNVLFVCVFKFGVLGILIATLIIEIGYSIYMLIYLRKNNLITFCIDKNILRDALNYSLPIMPHNLSTYIATFFSRIFINNNGSLSLVGLYSVAYQFSGIIDLIQTSVNRAFMPWFFETLNSRNDSKSEEIVNLSLFLLNIYSVLYVLIGLFAQEVLILITSKSYSIAWTTIPILVVAYSAKSIYYFYVNILFYYKEASKKLFIATITGSIADILIAFILIPKLGMYGAAISFLIAKIIVIFLVVLISNKQVDIGYRVKDMLKIVIPSWIFIGVGLYFSYSKFLLEINFLNFIYKCIILILYLTFVYLTNKKVIIQIINSRKNLMRKFKV
ncbi:oligosaccharide flippase family protein [Ureibacillus composti]